jgi:hypothetical protein
MLRCAAAKPATVAVASGHHVACRRFEAALDAAA